MKRQLVAPTRRAVRVAPVRPNLGLEIAFQKRVDVLLARMDKAILRAVQSEWRRKPPEMAQDESPAMALRNMIKRLASEWTSRFADFAQTHGRTFGAAAAQQTDMSYAAALKKAGFTVKFQSTAAWNDVRQATIQANVALIRSIPEQHFTAIEGIVMRGVQAGRNSASITTALQEQFGVTFKRAAFIARDQNNKATAAITRVRQSELGITEAIWMHSHGGRHPRPEHVAFSGKKYKIDKGAYLEGKWTWPGVEINCRCVSGSVIPGLDD